jgi:hypothetical protein
MQVVMAGRAAADNVGDFAMTAVAPMVWAPVIPSIPTVAESATIFRVENIQSLPFNQCIIDKVGARARTCA